MKLPKKILSELQGKMDDCERIGFIVKSGKSFKVIETINISPEPDDNFLFDPQDLMDYVLTEPVKAIATWHTHPKSDANLSANDYTGFRNYPQLKHLIIAKDEIRLYEVEEDGTVIQFTISG